MSTASRLSRLLEETPVLCFGHSAKIVLMSDCHRGIGNHADNFLANQHLFFAALQYYDQRDFTYIELGDGDELWENRNITDIVQIHSNAFWLMGRMYEKDHLYMLYGNHDRKKSNPKFVEAQMSSYHCDSTNCSNPLFPKIKMREAMVLEEAKSGLHILLAHGHQGDLLNDVFWRLGKWLVRHVWRKLELLGIQDPTSAAKNYSKKDRIEKKLSEWAREHKTVLITGHTHRPFFSTPGEGRYFNDGSCVHPRCITAIEIEQGRITLVKWSVLIRANQLMYVGREILEGPQRLSDYI